MFEFKRSGPIIPGYTGHLPKQTYYEEEGEAKGSRSEIPGYSGFIKGVKSENLFGKTYGEATRVSSSNNYYKGSEITPEIRYTSMLQDSYVNQRDVHARTVSEIVGVDPSKTTFSQKFYVEVPADEMTQTQQSGQSFYNTGMEPKERTFHDSQKLFYGEDIEKKGPLKLGNPIPGYTGVCRRVVADNVFGSTYAEARRKGEQSLSDIGFEKTNNFKNQSQMTPPIKK